MSVSSNESSTSGVEPLRVLQQRWQVILAGAIVGGLAGVAFATVRHVPHVAETVLIVGSVPSDPLRPGDRSMPLQPLDEVMAELKLDSTLTRVAGPSAGRCSVDAENVGQVGVHITLNAPDDDTARTVMNALLTDIETRHRALYDQWQESAANVQKEVSAPLSGTTDSWGNVAAEAARRDAAVVAALRQPFYARPTHRLAVSIKSTPRKRAKTAVAGAVAAGLAAWCLAYLVALIRRA